VAAEPHELAHLVGQVALDLQPQGAGMVGVEWLLLLSRWASVPAGRLTSGAPWPSLPGDVLRGERWRTELPQEW